VTGLQTALDAKAAASDVITALAGKAPVGHGHGITDVTGLQTALDAKAAASDVITALAGKAPVGHGHGITDVTGLQTALDAKAAASEVQTALNGKSPVAHGHIPSEINGLTAFIQSLQPVANIIVSATVPANPFVGLVWNEVNTNSNLIESWNYLNNRWQSITKYRSDYYAPSAAISGSVSYVIPFDDTREYLFKEFLINCIYSNGAPIDATTTYWRAIITTQPTGNTFASSGAIPNDSLSKRFTLDAVFAPATGERLMLMYQKIGNAPSAKIGTSFTYHLLRK
jgi:Phage tail repeat like